MYSEAGAVPFLFIMQPKSMSPNKVRQLKYRKLRIKGVSRLEAGLAAGYSENYITKCGKKLDKVVNMAELAKMAGLTDSALILYIKERLEAKKPIAADVFIRTKNGKLVVSKNSNDWIEYPDYVAQAKFLDTLLKLMGKIQSGTSVKVGVNVNNNTNGKVTDVDRTKQTSLLSRLDRYYGSSPK